MSKMEYDLNYSTFIEQSKTLYKDFMESFLNDKKMHAKRGAMTTYSSMINNHTLSSLGHLAISNITPRHIQDFYKISKNPVSLVERLKLEKRKCRYEPWNRHTLS
ncbi:N-terminal phage integrase SAM-like domain-containing protein [Paenibacillus polymyxa]|uniref:N-terminal phage integrase SAM-like domain-containing protein n=1 Tax=Paenibacillus polymyxa TaxID=1406 RepID=UPI003217FBBC